MKKTLLLALSVMVTGFGLHAQVQAYAGKIEYQKTLQPAAMIEIPYRTGVAEDAIEDFMHKKGFKGSGSKGFIVYRSFKLDASDAGLSDLYFKIEKKKKDNDYSIISLMTSGANVDILARPSVDSTDQMEKAKNFLNSLVPYIEEHNTDVEIGKQQEVLKKAQKKLNGYISDSSDLEKKIRDLFADQAQNKTDILKQTSEIQNTVSSSEEVKNKAQKKLNKLLDEQDNIAKKIRKAQAELKGTRNDLASQYQETDKQQQALDALKAKKKMN